MTNHPNRNRSLAEWASVRETSIEIARAIKDLARNQSGDGLAVEDAMQRIWEAPADAERDAVTAAAFASTDQDALFWGTETMTR